MEQRVLCIADWFINQVQNSLSLMVSCQNNVMLSNTHLNISTLSIVCPWIEQSIFSPSSGVPRVVGPGYFQYEYDWQSKPVIMHFGETIFFTVLTEHQKKYSYLGWFKCGLATDFLVGECRLILSTSVSGLSKKKSPLASSKKQVGCGNFHLIQWAFKSPSLLASILPITS